MIYGSFLLVKASGSQHQLHEETKCPEKVSSHESLKALY
jgi:hypothetical protein